MQHEEFQKLFFQKLKEKLPSHSSLVDEVAELLSISSDSAYRRIRGEKPLALDEVGALAVHFNISLDELLHLQTNNVVFNTRMVNEKNFSFDQYLEALNVDLKDIYHSQHKQIIYQAKDIPVFYHFLYPEMAAFKLFFWMKTILQFADYENKKFSVAMVEKTMNKVLRQNLDYYLLIPSAELWNVDTVTSIIRQILFYWEAGLFATKDDAMIICERLKNTIEHIQKQAELGFKFPVGETPKGAENNFQLYYNDIILADNSVYVETDRFKRVYLTHNVLNYLITADKEFCDKTGEIMHNLLSKSMLISGVSEKERYKFFNRIYKKIENLKEKIV